MNNKKLLNMNQAYDAMIDYLEKYYNKTHSDCIGGLLSGMMLLEDEKPFDPAAWSDWIDSVTKIKNKEIDPLHETLNIQESYDAVYDYVNEYYERIQYPKELEPFLIKMRDKNPNHQAWKDWLESVEKILTQDPKIRPYLIIQKIND